MKVTNKNKRLIPSNSKMIIRDAVPGLVIYTYEVKHRGHIDGYYACGFNGKAIKAEFRFCFDSDIERSEYIEKFFEQAEIDKVEKGRIKELKLHLSRNGKLLQEGDILYCRSGYDYSEVCFHEIVSAKGMMVNIKELKVKCIDDKKGKQCELTPQPGCYKKNGMLLKKVMWHDFDKPYIRFKNGSAYLWNGNPVITSVSKQNQPQINGVNHVIKTSF